MPRQNKRPHTATPKRNEEFKKIKENAEKLKDDTAALTTGEKGTEELLKLLISLVTAQTETLNRVLKLLEDTIMREPTEEAMEEHQPGTFEPKPAILEPSAEEKERLRSIVIQGLPESKETKPSEKTRADQNRVVELLDEIGAEVTAVSVYRLPGNQTNKPRLLKVVLATSAQQRETLKNAPKLRALKQTGKYPNVWIRPSMTAAQRKLDYDLRQAAAKLRNDGKKEARVRSLKLYVGSVEYDHVTLLSKNL